MTHLRTPDRNICLAWLRRFRPEVVGVIDCSQLPRLEGFVMPSPVDLAWDVKYPVETRAP